MNDAMGVRTNRTGTRRRFLLALVVLCLVTAGCSPPIDVEIRDVAILSTGEVVAWETSFSSGRTYVETEVVWAGEASEYGSVYPVSDQGIGRRATIDRPVRNDGRQNSACLSDGLTCFRFASNGAIEETLNNGDDWDTAWHLDSTSLWIRLSATPLVNDGAGDLHIRPFDVVVLPDDTAVFAMGDLDPLLRAPDGTWSVTPMELRKLDPWAIVVGAALVSFVLAAVALFAITRAIRTPTESGSKSRRDKLAVAAVTFVVLTVLASSIVAIALLTKGLLWYGLALLAGIMILVPSLGAAATFVGFAVFEVRRESEPAFERLLKLWSRIVPTLVGLALLYVLWAVVGIIGFVSMMGLGFIIVAAVAWTLEKDGARPLPPVEQRPEARSPKYRSIRLAVLCSFAVLIVGLVASTFVGSVVLSIPPIVRLGVIWAASLITLVLLLRPIALPDVDGGSEVSVRHDDERGDNQAHDSGEYAVKEQPL